MDFELKEVSIDQISCIIDEADESGIFLAHKDEPDFKVRHLFNHFQHNINFHIFVLTNGVTIAGFISILPTNEEYASSIGPMFISQKYQGMGLGRKQVAEIVKWAKSKQIKTIYTKTWGQNYRSRKIFESLGFTFITEIYCQRINGDSTVKYFYEIQEL